MNVITDLKDAFDQGLTTLPGDLFIDLADIGIDNVFDNEIVKELPVVKVIASLWKTGLNVRERFFAKKVIQFFDSFYKGTIDSDKLNEFREKMKDDKYKSKVTETIIIRLDKLDNTMKAKIVSNLICSYINDMISWNDFVEFSSIVNSLMIEDYETLQFLFKDSKEKVCFSTSEKRHLEGSAYKLVQFGLVNYEIATIMAFGVIPATIFHQINAKGISFYKSCENINIYLDV